MIRRLALALPLAVLPSTSLFCQTAAGTIPAGTPLAVSTARNYPMHAGELIEARLLYSIYADNKLVLEKGSTLSGSVVGLHADRSRRVRAELGGDFTPFHRPGVRFTGIVLADGSTVPFVSSTASDGAAIYRAAAPPPARGGLMRREFDAGVSAVRSDIATFTAPGKGDRLLQFVYDRLPWHPERIAAGTSWTVETAAPIELPAQAAPPPAAPAPPHKHHIWDQPEETAAPGVDSGAWIVQANLSDALSSETSTTGEPIQATVAEPIYNSDQTLAVPQGATLVGRVTRAKPSRSFGRAGVLNFNFSQLKLPDAAPRIVETRLTGADSAQDIALNSEGQAKAKPKDKISIPLILALMASRPLDQDEGKGHGSHDTTGKNATGGAAGLSLVGTVAALAGGSPYVASGIGYWGAACAFYYRWIARGQKITFAKDARIVVETTPRRSAALGAAARP